MAWLRLDDRFAHHPKVAHLTDKAFRAHVQTMLYCAEYDTDGLIPPTSFRLTGATPKVREQLVEAGLWDENAEKSELSVHDWRIYNGKTVEEKVSAVLASDPEMSANEIARLVGGNRQLVLSEIARQREVGGSAGGSTEPPEEPPAAGSGAVPENQSDRFQSGSASRARARGPVPSLDPVEQDLLHETTPSVSPELHDAAADGLTAEAPSEELEDEPDLSDATLASEVRRHLTRLNPGGATA